MESYVLLEQRIRQSDGYIRAVVVGHKSVGSGFPCSGMNRLRRFERREIELECL